MNSGSYWVNNTLNANIDENIWSDNLQWIYQKNVKWVRKKEII